MPEDSANSSKMSWSLTLTLLLLGHATTAAWNSFLNNEEYFKFKLRGGKAAESSEQADESNQLNCSMIIARYNDFSSMEKGLVCDGNACSKFDCKLGETVGTYSVEKSKKDDADFKKRVATVFDNFDEERNKFLGIDNEKTSKNSTTGPNYVTFWGSTLSSIALIITFLSANFAGLIIPHTGEMLRINVMLVIASMVFVVHIGMAWLLSEVTSFFVITLITVVVVILTSGIAQCSFFSVIGPMEPMFIVKLMEGQGLGGIVIAVFVIILDAIFKRNGKYGTDTMSMDVAIKLNVSIFFITTILALLGAIWTYHKIFKTSEAYRKVHQRTVSSTVSTSFSGNDEKNELLNTKTIESHHISIGAIISTIWKMMFSVFLNFFLCLSVFPACLTSIKWQNSGVDIFGIKVADWSFIKYSVFLMFNIGDWLGKKFGGVSWSSEKENLTLLIEIVKMPIFWVAFWICDLTGTKTGLFANGYFFGVLMLIFATSNGYFGTLPMAHAPQILERKLSEKFSSNEIKSAKEKVMPIMVASLVGGLMIGAFFSSFCVILLENAKSASRLEFQMDKIDSLLR